MEKGSWSQSFSLFTVSSTFSTLGMKPGGIRPGGGAIPGGGNPGGGPINGGPIIGGGPGGRVGTK